MKQTLKLLVATVCVLVLQDAAYPQDGYRVIDVKNGGTITGSVRFEGSPPKGLEMPVEKDPDWCGRKRPSPRLIIGKNKGVRYAIVMLENIREGKKPNGPGKYLLDQRKCEFLPHVMVLPLGASLDIVNSDGVLHNVHMYEGDGVGKTVFNIAQPIKGVRFTVKPEQFKKPGLYSATCDAGHPWMSGYVYVANHPYVVVTDEHGNYELTNVPPGTYRVKMWHEGVHITRTELDKGKPKSYTFEPPYEEIAEVTVKQNGVHTVGFSFVLRTPTISRQ